MKIRLLTVSLFLFFFCGCRSTTQQKFQYPNFAYQNPISATVISAEVMLPAMILDMEMTKDYFLVLCLHDGKWLHVFDKKSGELVKSVFTKGRGPGEIVGATQFSLDKRREKLSVFDREEKKLLTIDLDSLMNENPKSRVVSVDYFNRAEGFSRFKTTLWYSNRLCG